MAHWSMAAGATHRIGRRRMMLGDFTDEIAVAANTICFENTAIVRPQPNGLVKILQRKTLRVPNAVFGFGEILGDEGVVGSMAIVAGGDRVVTGFLPAVEVIAHDVAVGTGFRIVAEIREGLSVVHGVAARAKRNAEERAQREAGGAGPK